MRLVWAVKCLGLCLLGILIAGRLLGLLNPVVWWVFHQSGSTNLQRAVFSTTYYLPLIGLYGFVLGLIPIHRLYEAAAHLFGRIRFISQPRQELDISRPLLWAWVPVGLLLALRLVSFALQRDHSVLGPMPQSETIYDHFFAPLGSFESIDTARWMIDRLAITSRTLFLAAYTVGVGLRHQFPKRPALAVDNADLSV